MDFIEVTFATSKREELKSFYSDVLGFQIIWSDGGSFSLKAGKTVLTFQEAGDGTSPFYHFAFNIPSDAVEAARKYLVQRITPIEKDRQDVHYSPDWNSKALYFLDPAGNVVEFIARFNLPDQMGDGAFTPEHVLNVSEVGLPVPEVDAFIRQVQEAWNVPIWKAPFPNFKAMGDEEGLFIVAGENRIWFPTDSVAAVPFPVKVKCRRPGPNFTIGCYHFEAVLE